MLSMPGLGEDAAWTLNFNDLASPEVIRASSREPPIPSSVARALRKVVARSDAGVASPLWLDLVRPRGYLGALDWEGLLGRTLSRPVLRLSRLTEAPRENRDTLEIAICCDPAFEASPDAAARMVRRIIRAALGVARPAIRVHVFGTQALGEALAAAPVADARVLVHDPRDAPSFAEVAAPEGPGPLSPWFAWVSKATAERGLDAIHIIAPAAGDDDRPVALLSTSLHGTAAPGRSAVGPTEIVGLQSSLGAWAAIVSPPPDAHCVAACRYLADGISQVHPGPVLFCDLGGAFADIGRLYGFLFAPAPAIAPPVGRHFFHVSPGAIVDVSDKPLRRLVEAVRNAAVPKLAALPLAPRAIDLAQRLHAPTTNVLPDLPRWVSSAERYVERAMLEHEGSDAHVRPDPVELGGAAEPQGGADVIGQTLVELRSILADRDANGPGEAR